MRMMTLVSFLLLGAATAFAADIQTIAPDIVGAWQLTFTTPDGEERTPTVVMGRQRDELVAWYIDKGEPEAFKSVTVTDESLELTIVPGEKEGKATVKLVAKQDGANRCSGKCEYRLTDGETGSWTFQGKRVAPHDLPQLGQWKLKFTTPDGESHSPTIHVFENGDTLYAWYVSEEYELLAKSLKVDGDQATLSMAAKLADEVVATVTFRGTINGTTIKGNADYNVDGDRGSFAFTGDQVLN